MTCEGVEMREPEGALRAVGTVAERDYVEFWPASAVAAGRFRCTACGGAMHVKYVIPACPQCGERLWEREESSAYV
jgi:predicted RNA-binding Zn-ribbon protein involved in translation (DUF1610 family)